MIIRHQEPKYSENVEQLLLRLEQVLLAFKGVVVFVLERLDKVLGGFAITLYVKL
jgi:hypothetical protein